MLAIVFDWVGLRQRERALWTCASFCLPILLLLSVLVTLNGFTVGDKYIVFVALVVIVPLFGLAALAPLKPSVAAVIQGVP